MSSRDATVSRKLQAIYGAIDSGDLKGAVRLCERKDVADVAIVQAVKAYALEKRERSEEALEVARRVLSMGPFDDDYIYSTLNSVFTGMGCDADGIAMHEAVQDVSPKYAETLFSEYLRTRQLSKAQMLGMKMSKNFDNQEYLGWTGCAMVVESIGMTSELAAKKLAFAEATLRKTLAYEETVSDNRARTDAVKMTLVHVLGLQKKHAEITAFVSEHLDHIQRRERLLILAEAKQLDGQFEAAAQDFWTLLSEEDPEDWRNWSGFLECRFAAGTAPLEVLAQIEPLTTDAEGRPRRGPCLAQVHVHLRVALQDANSAAELRQAVFSYMERFDAKACCFGDLRNVLLAFTPGEDGDVAPEMASPPGVQFVYLDERLGRSAAAELKEHRSSRRWADQDFAGRFAADDLVTKIEERYLQTLTSVRSAVATAGQFADKKKEVRSVLSCLQILRYLGHFEGRDVAAMMTLVSDLVALYRETQYLDGDATGGETEVKVGDELVVLAAHSLIDLANAFGDQDEAACRRWLESAAALAEEGYAHSPNGFQLALVLLEVYQRLGAISRACEIYNGLGVKFIQTDSLSHVLLGSLLDHGHYNEALHSCHMIDQLWKSSRCDTPIYSIKALKLGNYSKAIEFFKLETRLRLSHQRCVAACERFFLEMALEQVASWDTVRDFVLANLMAQDPAKARKPTPFAELLGIDRATELCSNYDFTTTMTWDCPLVGRTAKAETQRLATRCSPTMSQSRACTASRTYDETWHTRALSWVDFRLTLGVLLFLLVNPSEEERSAAVEVGDGRAVKTDLVNHLETLGLVQRGLWPLVAEIAGVVVTLEDAEDYSKLGSQFDAMAASLDVERLPGESTQALLWSLSNDILVVTVAVRAWMARWPRRKNKKKNKSAQEEALEAMQKSLKTLGSQLLRFLGAIAEELSKRQQDTSPGEAAAPLGVAREQDVAKLLGDVEASKLRACSNGVDLAEKQRVLIQGAKYK
ncbi:N-alpha-acetyltransferase 25 [Durusdinium trenchii]|uniref:Uncharacterized protein n=1 Tax=Durusdinium trenchii TaxID=1381693 RepID=A0ABP0QCU8_9DINO